MKAPAPVDLNSPDPYEALGLDPAASLDEIKKAYFAQVRLHPPEREPAVFKQIRAAYERLNTAEKKMEADMLRIESWSEPTLTPPAPLEILVDPADILHAARACSDLARHDWREDWREVKL